MIRGTMCRVFALWLACAATLCGSCQGGLVQGSYRGSDTWRYVTRFVFVAKGGMVAVDADYPDDPKHSPALMLYYKSDGKQGIENEFGLWEYAYESNLLCEERARVAASGGLLLQLNTTQGVKKFTGSDGKPRIRAKFSAAVNSNRPRWLFVAVGNCDPNCTSTTCSNSLDINYSLELTNGEGTNSNFSYDEFWFRETSILFTALYILLVPFAIYTRALLLKETKYHHSAQLLVWSIVFSAVGSIFNMAYYANYANTGLEHNALRVTGILFLVVGQFLLLLMVILVAKGWTIVRRKISAAGRVRLAAYMTIYVVTTFACLIYYENVSDTAALVYIYSTPPGILLVALRFFSFIWFSYAVHVTLRKYQQKRGFYKKFWLFVGAWILTLPVLVCINAVVDEYMRAKVLNLIELFSSFICQLVMLVMYNPHPFIGVNGNFPFHASTNVHIRKERNGSLIFRQNNGAAQGSNTFEEAHLLRAFQISSQMRHSVLTLQTYTNDLHSFLDGIRQQSRPASAVGQLKFEQLKPVEKPSTDRQPKSPRAVIPDHPVPDKESNNPGASFETTSEGAQILTMPEQKEVEGEDLPPLKKKRPSLPSLPSERGERGEPSEPSEPSELSEPQGGEAPKKRKKKKVPGDTDSIPDTNSVPDAASVTGDTVRRRKLRTPLEPSTGAAALATDGEPDSTAEQRPIRRKVKRKASADNMPLPDDDDL